MSYSNISFHCTGINRCYAENIKIDNGKITIYYKDNKIIPNNYNDFKHLNFLGFKWGWKFNQVNNSIDTNELTIKDGQYIMTPSFTRSYIHVWESLIGLFLIYMENKPIYDVYLCNYHENELECNKELLNFYKYILPNTKFHINPCQIILKRATLIGRTMIGDMGGFFPSKIEHIKFVDLFLQYYNIPKNTIKNKNPKVYIIQRKKGNPGRNIINLDDMIKVIERFGCEVISIDKVYEEMTFKEQIELTRKVDILIGGHGGGLTNGLFLEKHSAVIEIYPWHFRDSGYSAINLKVGNYYQSIQAANHLSIPEPNKLVYLTSQESWRNKVV